MGEKVTVTFINGEKRQYDKGVRLLEIAQEMAGLYSSPVVAAKVNHLLEDLQYRITTDSTVDLLDLTTDAGIKVYQRSLTFVMIVAAEELFPEGRVTIEHSLGKGLYCELHLGRDVTQADVDRLKTRMSQIIAENRPFVRELLPIEESIAIFEAAGQQEKVKLLKQLKHKKISIYSCDNVADYVYGIMTPSTGYLQLFDIKLYLPGIILRFPDKENPKVLPVCIEQPKLAKVFLEAERWGEILQCGYVATLNERVKEKNVSDIIRIAEALHEKKIAQIADFIAEHRREVRVILIAGPSSSGKTTFAQRLNIQLRVNGVRPMPLSLDDYFVDREHTPRDENGDYDFEAIEAIDLELFNDHLIKILQGERVEIPTFNFQTGQREYRGQAIQIETDQPLIIEGIHGLNERLTKAIGREQKVKVYISALTQLAIDNHNRIPTTDTRLIRRLVRDSQFRGHDALTTLRLWQSVRRGEERNIFPFQEDADVMFNSALIYELAVLKKYAEPLLQQICRVQPEYSEAYRLLHFLEYFESIGDEEVPPNSILREFIGNSCFNC